MSDANALQTLALEHARVEGFDDAAVVPADTVLPDAARVKDAVLSGRMGPLAWMHETLDQRIDLKTRLPWARSVVVVIASYYAGDHDEHVADDGVMRAKVARYAWGTDYHNVLRRKLRRMRKALVQAAGGGRCAPFLDSDAVLERAWAKAAGLGFTGKSAMLIHPKLGTWTFLGGLVTEFAISPTLRPVLPSSLCGTCTACIDACPPKAIRATGVVDANRCLVTWNVEMPTDPRGDAVSAGSGWAVGCDVCQQVCPWNRFESRTQDERLLPRTGHVAFTAADAPKVVAGTPLARPGVEALPKLAARALAPRR